MLSFFGIVHFLKKLIKYLGGTKRYVAVTMSHYFFLGFVFAIYQHLPDGRLQSFFNSLIHRDPGQIEEIRLVFLYPDSVATDLSIIQFGHPIREMTLWRQQDR
jgi:hypothetical protein